MAVGYLYDVIGGDVMFYWTYLFGFLVLFLVTRFMPPSDIVQEKKKPESVSDIFEFCKNAQVLKIAITFVFFQITFHINETILPYHMKDVGVTSCLFLKK